MYTISTVASITLAAIGFLAVILLDNRRLRKRITDISHCVCKVAAGDLELKITESGRDELSDLAMDIDQMRRTLLDLSLIHISLVRKGLNFMTAEQVDSVLEAALDFSACTAPVLEDPAKSASQQIALPVPEQVNKTRTPDLRQ